MKRPSILVVWIISLVTLSFPISQLNMNPVTYNNINNNFVTTYNNNNNFVTTYNNNNNNVNMVKLAQPSFDYYTLAQQWPPGVCKRQPHNCKRIPRRFTIHGLWPSNKIQTHPRDCIINPSSFDFRQFQNTHNLLPQLSIDWPNLKGSNKKFWKSQWDKHGSCSQFKQSYYFQNAIYLRAKDNLTSILEVEGITPGGSYDKQAITDAIVKKIGVDPRLTCVRNTNYLAEIHLCLDPTLARYENCSSSHHQACTAATVLFEA